MADGCLMAPTPKAAAMEAGQKAILIDEGAAETIVFQITYSGARDRFAWVVPVPGRPGPGDVDEGSKWFVDYMLGMTSPVVVTEAPPRPRHALQGQTKSAGLPTGAEPAGAGGMPGALPIVTEWQRLAVGPYQVSVLSATGKGVLGGWLRKHGFQMPAAADKALDGYVGRGWYFVATRVQPGRAASAQGTARTAGGAWQGDLPPLAVRFPRPKKLVYPLAISRASTRGACVLDLTVMAPTPVNCDEAPLVRLGAARGRGSLADMLSRATKGGTRSLLLSVFRDVPLPAGAWCMARNPKPAGLDLRKLWTTRLWLRMPKERMVDLHFSPDASVIPAPDTESRLEIHRKPRRGASQMVLYLVLAAALLAIGYGVGRSGRTCCTVVGVLVLASLGAAWAGFAGSGSFIQYDRAAKLMTDGIERFRDLTGCFPERARDLVARRPPRVGLDASGNEVAIVPPADWQPPLGRLPVDPASRRRGGWLIDLAAPGYVSSRAFDLTVRWELNEGFQPVMAPLSPGIPWPVTMGRLRDPAYASAGAKGASLGALSQDTVGRTGVVWLGPDSDEGLASVTEAGFQILSLTPDGQTVLALASGFYAPPGEAGRWCIVEALSRGHKASPLGAAPVEGVPVAVTPVGGSGAAVAGVAEPIAASDRPGGEPVRNLGWPEYRPWEDSFVSCHLYLMRAGAPGRLLADVVDLRGLADAGDGRRVYVVSREPDEGPGQVTGGATGDFVLSRLDTATGRLAEVPGVGDVRGSRTGGWVTARDGYAWVVVEEGSPASRVLKRVSPSGRVDTILTRPASYPLSGYQRRGAPTVFAVAPGPGGRALVIVGPADYAGQGSEPKLLRVGAGAPVVLGTFEPRGGLDTPPTSYTSRRTGGPVGVAWPPAGVKDAVAVVLELHDHHYMPVLVLGSPPRLVACTRPDWPHLVFTPDVMLPATAAAKGGSDGQGAAAR